MVVKGKVVSEHVGDLGNIFEILRNHKLRLNASKCSFSVGSGKFLGYMVTHKGSLVHGRSAISTMTNEVGYDVDGSDTTVWISG